MIKKGDKIKVEYTGSLDDGTVFDSSEKSGQPLEFEAGSGQVIPGFENAVMGMEVGEEKEVHIPCKEAYGEPNAQMVQTIPRKDLPEKLREVKSGMTVMVGLPEGPQIPAKVVGDSPDAVTFDLNHPLAGQNLNFKIKIVSVN